MLEERKAIKTLGPEHRLRLKVRGWMQSRLNQAAQNGETLVDGGEVNATLLAEETINFSGHFEDGEIEAIMWDESHWVWDLAVDVADWWKERV